MSAAQTPTPEQVRNVRHHAAAASLSHLPEDKQKKIMASYVQQDARRERNVTTFINRVRG